MSGIGAEHGRDLSLDEEDEEVLDCVLVNYKLSF